MKENRFVTFIIQHNRIQGVFLLCKITNLLIYSLINILWGIYGRFMIVCYNRHMVGVFPNIDRNEVFTY